MNNSAASWMDLAIESASRVFSTTPNPRVGCVLVRDGEIVGIGLHENPGEHHAEEFELMFVLKGGGSANKTFLFQQTRAVLNKTKLLAFLDGFTKSFA
jgi:pyrimidine deaminase RibD-like protein